MNPDFGIKREWTDGEKTYLEIDTKKARFQGRRIDSMGRWGRRKFENLLIINRAKEKLKILYDDRVFYIPAAWVEN